MTDSDFSIPRASDSTPPPPPEMEEKPQVHQESELKSHSTSNPSTTFSIWPPSQRTRDAVVTRLIETLSTASVLSKRYGTVPSEESDSTARTIEEEAFAAAGGSAAADDDGIEILQIYSKEVSKRMLEAVKSRAPSPAPDATPAHSEEQSTLTDSGPNHTVSEVGSTVESEA